MNQPLSQRADVASSHIPRSKQQQEQRGDDEWTDGWMGLVLCVVSQLKSSSVCL